MEEIDLDTLGNISPPFVDDFIPSWMTYNNWDDTATPTPPLEFQLPAIDVRHISDFTPAALARRLRLTAAACCLHTAQPIIHMINRLEVVCEMMNQAIIHEERFGTDVVSAGLRSGADAIRHTVGVSFVGLKAVNARVLPTAIDVISSHTHGDYPFELPLNLGDLECALIRGMDVPRHCDAETAAHMRRGDLISDSVMLGSHVVGLIRDTSLPHAWKERTHVLSTVRPAMCFSPHASGVIHVLMRECGLRSGPDFVTAQCVDMLMVLSKHNRKGTAFQHSTPGSTTAARLACFLLLDRLRDDHRMRLRALGLFLKSLVRNTIIDNEYEPVRKRRRTEYISARKKTRQSVISL